MQNNVLFKKIPKGWIPPPPYILRTRFDKSLPEGKQITMTKPRCNVLVFVTMEEGISLDDSWETWFQENKEDPTQALPFGE